MLSISIQKEKMKHYDVIVIGGGLTGVAAAIGASREGCKTLLLEKNSALGGAATNCLVNPFMGYTIFKENETELANAGFFIEVLNELKDMGGLMDDEVTFNEEFLKIILDRKCKVNNVDVVFQAVVSEAVTKNDNIEKIVVSGKYGFHEFKSNYYIDCSGDGDVAVLAGCDYEMGDKGPTTCQPMTLCFRLSGVDKEKAKDARPRINELYVKLQKEGKIKNPRQNVLMFDNISEGIYHFNTTRIIRRNPVDLFDVSAALMEAREQIYEVYNLLKDNIPGFENTTVAVSANEIGVRESRQIKGEYTITKEDILGCEKFDDSIARGVYELDLHNPYGTGTLLQKIPKGEYYTIPYRALTPKKINNLLVAGRCISATHEAMSAFRIMPIVCCIGEGAGLAVSQAVKDKSALKEINIKAVQALIAKYKGKY